MLLKEIIIQNYRNIKDLTIDLKANTRQIEKDIFLKRFKYSFDKKYAIPGITYLYGRNGIGKSTILSAISFIGDIFRGLIGQDLVRKLIWRENAQKFLPNPLTGQLPKIDKNYNSLTLNERINKEIQNKKGKYYEKFLVEQRTFYESFFKINANDLKSDIRLELKIDNGHQDIFFTIVVDYEGNININFSEKEQKKINEINDFLRSIFSDGSSYFNQGIIFTRNRQNNISNIGYLSSVLINLKNKIGSKNLIKILQLADNSIYGLNFITQKNNSETINEYINNNGKKINLLFLSTGTRNFISLVHLIIIESSSYKKPFGLVLIDEIDVSLHIELINVLKFLMQKSFEKYNTQFIVSTHTPLITNNNVSYKQVFSLGYDDEEELIIEKLSSHIKPHQNIFNAYERGILSNYPDKEYARNVIANLEW